MPRALVLTHTPPFPLVSGERIRNFHLLRELGRHGWDVTLFALDPGSRSTSADRAQLAQLCDDVHVQPMDPSRWSRLSSLLLRRPLYERFFYDAAADAKVRKLLGGAFDVIVVEGLYMGVYMPDPLRRGVLLDAHNAELLRVESMSRALGLKPRGLAARLQRRPLRDYERRIAASADAVTCVSTTDADYFETVAPGRVSLVPNGVDCRAISPRRTLPRNRSLLFVGSMDYSANVDAVGYLAREVMPALADPDVTVRVIGSNPGKDVVAHARRSPVPIEILGYVHETTPYFAESRIFVVPLRFGGGTRLKILEALARGVPVVTTSVGCEGLELEHERDLIVADDPHAFARWLERLLRDDELCARLAQRGRATVERLYDWQSIGAEFEAAARKLLRAPEYDPAVVGGTRLTVGRSRG